MHFHKQCYDLEDAKALVNVGICTILASKGHQDLFKVIAMSSKQDCGLNI
jgi:hypothetical protein